MRNWLGMVILRRPRKSRYWARLICSSSRARVMPTNINRRSSSR